MGSFSVLLFSPWGGVLRGMLNGFLIPLSHRTETYNDPCNEREGTRHTILRCDHKGTLILPVWAPDRPRFFPPDCSASGLVPSCCTQLPFYLI